MFCHVPCLHRQTILVTEQIVLDQTKISGAQNIHLRQSGKTSEICQCNRGFLTRDCATRTFLDATHPSPPLQGAFKNPLLCSVTVFRKSRKCGTSRFIETKVLFIHMVPLHKTGNPAFLAL